MRAFACCARRAARHNAPRAISYSSNIDHELMRRISLLSGITQHRASTPNAWFGLDVICALLRLCVTCICCISGVFYLVGMVLRVIAAFCCGCTRTRIDISG